MKAGIIAAGIGERLAKSGVATPKPLVQVGGKPMIARTIEAAADLGVSSVACIVNEINRSVADYLASVAWPVPVEMVVKTTPSSMESLFQLAPLLGDEPFILLTVDAVFRRGVLEDFLEGARSRDGAKAVLALTDFVDDEKPLWVNVDARDRITAMGKAAEGSRFITAGFYYFTPDVFSIMDEARRREFSALRRFLGLLVDSGFPVYGQLVSKTIDVDYPEDIAKAEAYLKEINEA